MALKFKDLRGQIGVRVWYEERDAFAFVLHAPLTFGHSQLVVRVRSASSEEHIFERASLHIASCIRALRTKLPTGSRRTWKELINYTGTTGKYQKTLVLKTSADETADLYKVHLVPFYASHLQSTIELYQNTHGHQAVGGLLHWLGEREVVVDRDLRNDPIDVKARTDSFNLEKLAMCLRRRTVGA
jgi:hypothetical protein